MQHIFGVNWTFLCMNYLRLYLDCSKYNSAPIGALDVSVTSLPFNRPTNQQTDQLTDRDGPINRQTDVHEA